MTKSKKKEAVDLVLRAKMKELGWTDAPDGLVEKIRLNWGNQARWVLVDGRWYYSPEDKDRLDKSWRPSIYGPD